MNSRQHNKNNKPKKKYPIHLRIGRCLLKSIIGLAALGVVFRLVWNWAGVSFFTFPPLTYLQAMVAILTAGLLCIIGMRVMGCRRSHQLSHPSHGCGRSSDTQSPSGKNDGGDI